MRKIISLIILVCAFTMGLPRPAISQVTGGTISGTIRNQVQEPVAGAKVTATNTGTNQSRTTLTDSQGFYRLPGLAVGQYELMIEADTYPKRFQQATLRVNEDMRLDAELLTPGSSEVSTVVAASSPITESTSSVLGVVIDNKQIAQLPINGGNFLQLGTLVANVNSTPSLRSGSEGGARNGPFSVAGQRDRSLSFLVDGVDNTNSLSDNLSARVSIDAIQEFKMITNLGPAEYGYHSGGTINIITKSGSNDFHFGVFEYLRNNKLNAPNYFEEIAGQAKSKANNNLFGGTISGPAIKDRTFFFANYEGQRLRAGTPQFASVPTDAQRKGIFVNRATGQTVQLAVDPVAAELLRRYIPVANVQSKFGNFFGAPTTTYDSNFGVFKVDHLLSGVDVLNARYYIYDARTFFAINPEGVRATGGRASMLPGFALIEPTRSQNLALAFTHNFSDQMINDLRFGYNRYALDQTPQQQIKPGEVGFTGVEPGKGALIFSVGGISSFGAIAYPIYSRFGNYHIADSLSLTKGRHSLKTGAEIRLIRQSLSHFEPGHTTFAFSGSASRISPLADFILGIPAAVVVQSRTQAAPMRQETYGFFVQDDYQVNRRLVLNIGLRYELATVLTSPEHKLTNFSFARGLFTPGVDTDTELYKGDHNNFAPRIGFAWSVTGDGRTVLRGGYGVYYDTIVHTNASTLNRQNASDSLSKVSIAPRGAGRLATMLMPNFLVGVPVPAVGYDENLRTPYAQHFNLTLQRELSRSTVVSLGYVGSKGTRLTNLIDINQAVYIPGTGANGQPLSTGDTANINSRRPSQTLHLTPTVVGAVETLQTGASSIYHSFQATVNKRLGHGLSVLGTYTWSKSIDDSSDPYGFTGDSGFAQDSTNLRQERGLSIFDIGHQFTLACAYELPFHSNKWVSDWQVNSVVSLKSGQPFTPILGFDPSVSGRSFVRPNYDPNAFVNKDGQLYLNRSLPLDPATGLPASIVPQTGKVGNLGRNVFTGPGYKNVDLSVIKRITLSEKLKVQARAEMFNAFNTANLALPERRLTDTYFGLSSRTQDVAGGLPGMGGGGPRSLQLALQFIY
jgi:hypothetical protein